MKLEQGFRQEGRPPVLVDGAGLIPSSTVYYVMQILGR